MLKLTGMWELLLLFICIKCHYIIFYISLMSLNKFEIMSFLKQRNWKNKQKVLILEGVQRGLTCMIKGYREIDLWRMIKGAKYVYCRLTKQCIRRNMITVFKYLMHVNTMNREEMNIWVNFSGGNVLTLKSYIVLLQCCQERPICCKRTEAKR